MYFILLLQWCCHVSITGHLPVPSAGNYKVLHCFPSSDKLTRAVVMQERSPALATHPIISSAPTQLIHLHPFITAGVLSRGGFSITDTLLGYCSLLLRVDHKVWWGVQKVGRGIIKAAELDPHDLCIYSSRRKLHLKRSGNLTGHRPNPHCEGARRWRGQEGRDKSYTAGHMAAHWKLTCEERKKKKSIRGRCMWWLLFAHRLWLMSLKGQTPLRKINGVSQAQGNGLWGPAGRICNMTVITTTEQWWKEWSGDGDDNVWKCWTAEGGRKQQLQCANKQGVSWKKIN